MSRRNARERVLQALYQLEFQPQEKERIIADLAKELTEEIRTFYFRLLEGIDAYQDYIDNMIEKYLKAGWSLQRIATVDRAILRIAMYELLYDTETPQKVVINEAVEMAKKFSGDESSRFINGCLGNWYREQAE